jgi:hypothetical protein
MHSSKSVILFEKGLSIMALTESNVAIHNQSSKLPHHPLMFDAL